MNAILFCGCLVRPALRASPKWNVEFSNLGYGSIPAIHNFGQVFQTIDVWRGEKTIPQELLVACRLPPSLRALEGDEPAFSDVDLVLLEASTPVELLYRGHQLHAFGVTQKMLKPLFPTIPGLEQAAAMWRKGLYTFDDATRAEGAAQIHELVTADTAQDQVLRSVVEETRSSLTDIPVALGRLRQIFPGPLCVILRHFRYMPDGRVVDWPAGFSDEMRTAAEALGIPVFDPAPTVLAAGAADAFAPGDAHYSRAFLPIIGAEITEFALSVARRA